MACLAGRGGEQFAARAENPITDPELPHANSSLQGATHCDFHGQQCPQSRLVNKSTKVESVWFRFSHSMT